MSRLMHNASSERVKEYSPPPPPGQPYTKPLPGTKRDGKSAIYRHWRFQDSMMAFLDPKVRTMHDSFEETVKFVPTNKCFGHRPYDATTKTFGDYVWDDYATIAKRRANLGAGLVRLRQDFGVSGSNYGVGIWSQNRPEWQITDLACMSQSLFTVSLYDTLGPDAVEYIISQADLACVVTSLNHVAALLKLKPRLPTLKCIVSLDPLDAGERPGESKQALLNALAEDQGVSIHYILDVEALGASNPIPFHPPQAEDVITINYTSGTTGNPKGVVLTHANALASTCGVVCAGAINAQDVTCSFLPLAHIYQRINEHSILFAGGAIGYFHGDILGLIDDVKLVRPTTFSAVPRLFNRFGSAIKVATLDAPGIRGKLSNHVVNTKLANLNNPDPFKATNTHALYDRIWSKKVAAQFGLDRARVMVSGASPIDPNMHQFLRIVFCNTFSQGYGMTEAYASTFMQLPGDMTSGNCGALFPHTEACLLDVPDMEYLSSDKPFPRGELLIRGKTIFREYFKNPEETAKAIDADGWLHTGDIVTVDALGRFSIIDRVKNLLKLAQGEYISPERIETVLLTACPWAATAYVHGDSTQSSLVALFGVSPDAFAPFAAKVLKRDVCATDVAALKAAAAERQVVEAAQRQLDAAAKEAKLNGYERVRACWLGVDPFTVENDLMTPTFKTKRPKVAKFYRGVLDDLYAEVEAQDAKKLPAKL